MRPRPAIIFSVGYWAGLATGLLHFGSPLGVGTVAFGLALARLPFGSLAAGGLMAGRVSGEVAAEMDRSRCTARLPHGSVRLRVRVLEPADSVGGRVAVMPTADCRGSVSASWVRRSPVQAGREALVEGRWMPRPGFGGRPGGMLVIDQATLLEWTPGPADRLNNYLYSGSHRLYGARAGMIDALILGRRGGIDPALQDRFARSGLVHLLSISGFHVGLITAWVFLIGRLARLGRSPALILAAGASAAYVAFLGWPAPAARAAALAVVLARCRTAQRHVQPDALLAATCLLVLLADPWAALDLGGWLSAAALWGASHFTRWSDGAVGTGFLARTAASSFGATLATAPVTAAFLGTVALAGLFLNFPAIPVAAIAVPGVLASLVLDGIWPGAAEALAAGSGLALHLLEWCAVAGAALPVGHFQLERSSPLAAAPWIGALLMALWILGDRNTVGEAARRLAWSATVAAWLHLFARLPVGSPDGGGSLALHFLDVGQGDGAAVRTPGGRWVVIDAGPAGERDDAGRRVMVPFLERHGVRALSALVVSHPHADHMGGVGAVLRRFPVGLVVEPAGPTADPSYAALLTRLDHDGIRWHPARSGERFVLDGVTFSVLHPSAEWSGWGSDVNEDSVVLLVRYGDFEALFTGDAGFPAEAALRGAVRRVDLLKVGHHGSRGSTGDELLDSLRPVAAVVSVGRNDYGHPAPATLARMAAHRVRVFRTDRDGAVTVTTDGGSMTITSAQGDLTYPVKRAD